MFFKKRHRSACLITPSPELISFDPEKLESDLMAEALVLGLSAAEFAPICQLTVASVAAWAKDKPLLTKADLDRQTRQILEVYCPDLAYILQIRDKII